MTDILALRFQAANDLLGQIDERLTNDKLRQRQLQALNTAAGEAYDRINEVIGDVEDILQDLRKRKPALKSEMQSIYDTLESARGKMSATLRKSIVYVMAHSESLGALDLLDRPGALVARSKLQEQVSACRGRLVEIDRLSGAERWGALIDYEATNQDQLLSAYVDLFAGLSLRWSEFDEGLCTIADRLIDSCAHNDEMNMDLFSIPNRRSSLLLNPVISVRFPESAFWELPFAASELWSIVIAPDDRVKAELTSNLFGGERAAFEAGVPILADFFGAYCMGPAFACTALLLRFQPTNSAHQERARRVLAMLEYANANTFESPWGEVIDGLRDDWDRAVAQALGDAPRSRPTEQDKTYAKALAEAVNKPTKFRRAQFQMSLYNSIRDMKKALVDDATAGIRALDMRQLLNAAWMARREQPGLEDQLRKRASALGGKLEKPDVQKTAYGMGRN